MFKEESNEYILMLFNQIFIVCNHTNNLTLRIKSHAMFQ